MIPYILLLCFISQSVAEQQASVDPGVTHLFVGFRHGIRNPGSFCCGYNSTFEPNMLTTHGIEETYNNGKFLRSRYGNLLDSSFKSSQITAISSTADRCQQTMQSFLAGFYQPKTAAIPGLNWSPIGYKIDAPLLRMYDVACPEQTKAWDPVSYDRLEPMQKVLKEKGKLIDFVIAKSGFKVGSSKLSTMADIADNIINLKIAGMQVPDWVKNGMEGVENLEEAILEFGEIHQIACAKYQPCRYMMSGLWLNDIYTNLMQKLDGKQKDKRMNVYTSHTEITLAALYAMGVAEEKVKEVPMGGGFIIELKEKPTPMVRVLFLHPNVLNVKTTPELQVVTPGVAEWMSASSFAETLKKNSFSDWEMECKLPQAECNGSNSLKSLIVALAFPMFAFLRYL